MHKVLMFPSVFQADGHDASGKGPTTPIPHVASPSTEAGGCLERRFKDRVVFKSYGLMDRSQNALGTIAPIPFVLKAQGIGPFQGLFHTTLRNPFVSVVHDEAQSPTIPLLPSGSSLNSLLPGSMPV